jgi:hypothetical protein
MGQYCTIDVGSTGASLLETGDEKRLNDSLVGSLAGTVEVEGVGAGSGRCDLSTTGELK